MQLILILFPLAVSVLATNDIAMEKRKTEVCYFNALTVNCRARPSLNSGVVTQLGGGAYFSCFEYGDCYEDNWYVFQ
jgi:hypothetical protein